MSTLFAGAALVLAFPVSAFAQETAASEPSKKPERGSFGFDETGMDRSVAPGDDFYAYANGGWAKNTPIPSHLANYGMFSALDDLSKARVRDILDGARSDSASQIGRAYASYLDSGTVEARGLTPIEPWLDKIKGLRDRKGYTALVAEGLAMGVGGPVACLSDGCVLQDDGDPKRALFILQQAGTGLPDRDMYLLDDPNMARIRGAYAAHLARLLALAGETNVDARAQALLALEADIAKVHWTREDSTDVAKIYNKVGLDRTAQFASPTFDFTALLRALSPKITEVQVMQPSAFVGIAAILDKAPLQLLRDQMIVRSLESLSTALPDAVANENFAFYGTVLKGTPEREPRWRLGVSFTEAALGDAVGREYVERHFPAEYKAEMARLVDNIIGALGHRIDRLEWMQPETRVRARKKLDGFMVKVGYPDRWRDYAGLEIKSDDLFGNLVRANRFNFQYQLDRLGKPFPRDAWLMSPQTANAYANFGLNEIVFPAGILLPPFFDPNADPALNYGAIGGIIGHEISHHFDDQGAKYDEEGKLSTWWTPEDVKAFTAAGKSLSALYESYEPLPGEHIKGEFTLGENIGDLAGLTIAYEAYRNSLGGQPAPVIDGVSGDQRFFLGWAQIWRRNYREADLRQRLLTDPHAPAIQRVWMVRNIDAWYPAFGVRPGQKLYLEKSKRVRVW
ncbi:M13 family metallopeptidase [Sphingopyxis fribergensis]